MRTTLTGSQAKAARRRKAQETLQEVIESETATDAQKVAASRALLLDTRTKRKVPRTAKPSDSITGEDIARMRVRLREEPGMELFAERRGDQPFVNEFKQRAERSLYFFTKFTGIAPDLTPTLHKEACKWLQSWPPPGDPLGRVKLFMMPTQHLKTSMASHGLPLHMVIQPEEKNLYFPGQLGRDTRIALIGESADKAIENLSVVTTQLEENAWIRACWPECVWQDVSKAPNWSRTFATVPRKLIRAEPTFTALGVGTALYQRHWDFIDCDDLIGWAAAESPATMAGVDEWRRGLLTRRHSPLTSIMLFIGTHFGPRDIYVSMKSELPKEVVISRSVIEHGEPIWPERFPLVVIEQLKRDMKAKLFSHLMMNLPTSEGFTGFNWNLVRLFEFEDKSDGVNGALLFIEEEIDDEIRAIYADPIAKIVSRWKAGEPLSALYPNQRGREFVDPYDEKMRDKVGRLPFGQQTDLKQFAYLRAKYGDNGEGLDINSVPGGGGRPEQGQNAQGFDSVTFRSSLLGSGRDREGVSTTRVRRAVPD